MDAWRSSGVQRLKGGRQGETKVEAGVLTAERANLANGEWSRRVWILCLSAASVDAPAPPE